MMSHYLLLLSVMLVAGVVAGLVNFYLWRARPQYHSSLLLNCCIGIGGAFVLPLILLGVSAEVLSDEGDAFLAQLRYFVLALASAAVACCMILTLPLMLRDQELASEGGRIPLDRSGFGEKSDVKPVAKRQLSADAGKLFKALASGQYPYRALAGLCKDTGLDNATALLAMDDLQAVGLLLSVNTQKGVRWHLSEAGQKLWEKQKNKVSK